MDQKHIIKFEQGILYLRLREEFNAEHMRIVAALARISPNGLELKKCDSKVDATATSLILTRQELTLIAEGYAMVKHFWTEQQLAPRHVLLSCGCIFCWDELEHWDQHKGGWVWCPNHEEAKVAHWDKVGCPEAELWHTPESCKW